MAVEVLSLDNVTGRVSIIIPVYNSKKYIEECVNSILYQKYADWELILVDDGSIDGSAHLCDELSEKDNRISVYHIPNGGAGNARKYGVSKARGKWIMFVDSDDTITMNGLSILMSLMKDDFDLIAGAINRNDTLFAHHRDGIFTNIDYISFLLSGETTDGPVAKIFKKNLFEQVVWDVSKEITQNEDLMMLIAYAVNAKRVYLISDVVCYNYKLRDDGISSSTMKYISWKKLFKEIESVISPIIKDNPKVEKFFCSYQLRRLYYNVVLKGEFLSRDKFINELLLKCERLLESKDELKQIKVISSKNYQVIEFVFVLILRHLYTLKKKITKLFRCDPNAI